MPELPDIVVYIEALEARLKDREITGFRVASPSVLRTYDPMYTSVVGETIVAFERIGKRIVLELTNDLWMVIHLMVAGRFRWYDEPKKAIPKKVGLAALDVAEGTLILTEQGTKKRAGIWIFGDRESVDGEDRGGVEPLGISIEGFAEALTAENRTLKRALTDPRIFSGIGNAFSDEILWEARLSPVKRTSQLSDEEVGRLHTAVQTSLTHWTQLLREQSGDGFPSKVTAFRPEMATHGKFKEPCPRCGHAVQRIVYASNETNYCPTCQTEGKILADRSLSRLLKDDWPSTVEELEGE